MPTIHHGDCIQVMNAMPANSIDAIVTDPPYGLGFMGRKWDSLPPSLEWSEACMRVLKPGAHIVAFGGTRTWHRLAVAIEDAGFEMRDSLAWLYGSGFPKSHNVGKMIDRNLGAVRPKDKKVTVDQGANTWKDRQGGQANHWVADAKAAGETHVYVANDEPITPEAAQWDGWGTALKPAFEPIVLARKPLAEKTVARNVLAHGTGAINIDGCRVEGEANRPMPRSAQGGILRYGGCHTEAELRALAEAGEKTPNGETATLVLARAIANRERNESRVEKVTNAGRWPANVLLDHHAAAWVDEQSGISKSKAAPRETGTGKRGYYASTDEKATATLSRLQRSTETRGHDDSGGASRFFYTAKAPKRERPNVDGVQHPTVKPLAIMRWLIRLVTPPGGVVLDPFAGSGTTIEAALIEGFDPVGIEMEPDYLPLIQHRIDRQAGTLTA